MWRLDGSIRIRLALPGRKGLGACTGSCGGPHGPQSARSTLRCVGIRASSSFTPKTFTWALKHQTPMTKIQKVSACVDLFWEEHTRRQSLTTGAWRRLSSNPPWIFRVQATHAPLMRIYPCHSPGSEALMSMGTSLEREDGKDRKGTPFSYILCFHMIQFDHRSVISNDHI